jgi:adenylosuccinate lyase
MELTALTAISPVDGRYRKQTSALATYFSEFGLIHYRVKMEIAYLLALRAVSETGMGQLTETQVKAIEGIAANFTEADALKIKSTEAITNHDVKAVEYFIKEKLDELQLQSVKEFVHFGLTSQDVNNTSIPWSIKDFLHGHYIPAMKELTSLLRTQAVEWMDIPMLAHTHGQPASPTRLGKEWMVFVERLEVQLKNLESIPFSCKFGGATGNFNAHHVAYPQVDWISFANGFTKAAMGLDRQQFTTQIEHYDQLAAVMDNCKRINIILMDFCKDVWQYISMEYFRQKIKANEVGSSAMPHKVNPIDFENAEGNFGVANALLEHLSHKLPISRLQRDLTDSTVLRNVGVPFSHMIISLNSIQKGLGKLILNEAALRNDLENNWMVVAEAIQTILRREQYPNPYEALKALTRGAEKMNEEILHAFVDGLEVSDAVKAELKNVTPYNYIGIVAKH